MTGKIILLLSAAAAGVLALFIAVRIYEPVHEIPVSLKIKNDTDGTIGLAENQERYGWHDPRLSADL